MHDAATHSVVSDALVALATSVPDPSSIEVARKQVEQARRWAAEADTSPTLRGLVHDDSLESTHRGFRHDDAAQSPRGDDDAEGDGNEDDNGSGRGRSDARTRAWTLGVNFASHKPSSPDAPVLAAVIALCERMPGTTDVDVASAVAVGTQATARLLRAVDSDEFRARWNVASALGIVGATLALSRLIGLDATQTRHALGIAATQAAGLARNNHEPMHAIETGKAAADAVEASLLAKHGFTSAAASIDGRRGLAALMAYRFDINALTGEHSSA